MDQVRIGIIGIGNMGSAHARSIHDGHIEGLSLAAICDTDKKKLDWCRENLDGVLPLFTDYREMIGSGHLDAVLIATPHYLHPEIAVYAFSRGLHVLTEKPAGVFTTQVEEMNRAAESAGTVFGIMYNQRTDPLFQKAKELVESGRLGHLKRSVWIITNWYRTQAYYDSGSWRATWAGEGGGVLINQCPHNLDLWQWICGMPEKVRGFCDYGKYHHIEVEDEATIYVRYPGGATGVFLTSTGECPGTNRLEISGEGGKMVLEEGKLKFWELKVPERKLCFMGKEGSAKPETVYSEFSEEASGDGHELILRNFADAILQGEPLLAPGKEGINGLSISNAAHLSDWTEDWVSLPVDGELFRQMLREKAEHSSLRRPAENEAANPRGIYSDRWNVRW